MAQYISNICFPCKQRIKFKPKTLIELVSGMIVPFIINKWWWHEKRSHFKEINNENVLLGANLSYQAFPNWILSDLSEIIFNKVCSSVYPTIKKWFITVESWQIYKLNKGGDQMVPWGIPAVIGYKLDESWDVTIIIKWLVNKIETTEMLYHRNQYSTSEPVVPSTRYYQMLP